jgi:hypothetical protein
MKRIKLGTDFTAATGSDVGRLYDALLETSPDTLVGIVGALAVAGDTAWLEMILRSGTAAKLAEHLTANEEAVANSGPRLGMAWSTRRDLFKALLHLEKSGIDPHKTKVLDEWADVLAVGPTQIQQDLMWISDPDLLRTYLQRGAHPNAPATGQSSGVTALGSAASNNFVSGALAMLALLAERNEIPLQSVGGAGDPNPVTIFEALAAERFIDGTARHLMDFLLESEVPETWLNEIGKTLRAHRIDGPVLPRKATLGYCQLLSIATFASDQEFIDEVRSRGASVAHLLASTSDDEGVRVVLTKLCRLGVDIDSFPCTIFDGNFPKVGVPKASGTMLHAAILAGNLHAIQLLLSAGADPLRTVTTLKGGPTQHPTLGKDALTLATGDTRAAIDAWRARQAVQAANRAPRPHVPH